VDLNSKIEARRLERAKEDEELQLKIARDEAQRKQSEWKSSSLRKTLIRATSQGIILSMYGLVGCFCLFVIWMLTKIFL